MPWLACVAEDAGKLQLLSGALQASGMQIAVASRQPASGTGILLFDRPGNELLEEVNERSAGGQHRLLAVACGEAPDPVLVWELLDAGAADVLPWRTDAEVISQVRSRLQRWSQVDELLPDVEARLIGKSALWRRLLRQIVEVSQFSEAPVLLLGESGTGKELLARLVHEMDGRAGKRELITVDCTTIVPELSGSELFGHERGAYTGAVSARDGAFALANGGTLFLDEVGELNPPLQAQLLRAVQEKTYKRVGGNSWQQTSFRLVCATNRNLQEAAACGAFRPDLYYRIAAWVFRTPPLRDRPEDVLPLARHFLQSEVEIAELDPAVEAYLVSRQYPGNVRELRQLVTRIAYRHVGPGPITPGDIPPEERPAAAEFSQAWPDEQFEASIRQALNRGIGLKQINRAAAETAIRISVQREDGNLQRAARRLGVTDRALQMRKANRQG